MSVDGWHTGDADGQCRRGMPLILMRERRHDIEARDVGRKPGECLLLKRKVLNTYPVNQRAWYPDGCALSGSMDCDRDSTHKYTKGRCSSVDVSRCSRLGVCKPGWPQLVC